MVVGVIKRFADPSGIEGDPLDWIDLLLAYSKPGFSLPAEDPMKSVLESMEAFEFSRIVAAAIDKHRPAIRKLKEMEQLNQNLAVSLMVERAYIRGACDFALDAWENGQIARATAQRVGEESAKRGEKIWREAAKMAVSLLLQIRKHAWLKGRKGNPASLGLVTSTRAMLDDEIIDQMLSEAPAHLRRDRKKLYGFLRTRITTTVRERIRLGRLMADGDPIYAKECIDVHARRIRKRLKKHFADVET